MATTTLTPTGVKKYNGANSWTDDSPVAGIRSGTTRVVRYTYTIPSGGASAYSVMISGCSALEGTASLRCILTTSDSSHAQANSTYVYDTALTRRATTTGKGEWEYYSGTVAKSLSAGTYYLYVFAGSTATASAFLPQDGYQYQTSLATITITTGTGSSGTGTTVSGTTVTFTDDVTTDSGHPYRMIVRVQETSQTSTSATFSLKVALTSTASGAGYECRYGNKLDIKINNTSQYYSDNITNGSYVLDINYGSEVEIYSGSFTLTRGSNGIATGVLYVNFQQVQFAPFNAVVQETISSGTYGGYVYIDNGSSFDKYEVYIDNGSSWDRYTIHIDNGSSWDTYG